MAQAKEGDRVQIHYTGRLPDGEVFDSSREREPLEFTAGSDELIPGVSSAVIGMEVGATQTVSVPPEAGYGPRNEELMQKVPRDVLPEEVNVGDPLRAESEDGEIQVWVRALTDEYGIVDANHPLAGQTLEFEIEMVAILEDGE